MLVELSQASYDDLLKIRDWVTKNYPDSRLFIGYIDHDLKKAWESISWDTAEYSGEFTECGYSWAVDIPDEDAVYFKLVWG